MNQTLVEKREQSATEERRLGSNTWLVAPGVWRLKDLFVNVFLIQNREGTEWVLVDAATMRPHRIPADMLPAFQRA